MMTLSSPTSLRRRHRLWSERQPGLSTSTQSQQTQPQLHVDSQRGSSWYSVIVVDDSDDEDVVPDHSSKMPRTELDIPWTASSAGFIEIDQDVFEQSQRDRFRAKVEDGGQSVEPQQERSECSSTLRIEQDEQVGWSDLATNGTSEVHIAGSSSVVPSNIPFPTELAQLAFNPSELTGESSRVALPATHEGHDRRDQNDPDESQDIELNRRADSEESDATHLTFTWIDGMRTISPKEAARLDRWEKDQPARRAARRAAKLDIASSPTVPKEESRGFAKREPESTGDKAESCREKDEMRDELDVEHELAQPNTRSVHLCPSETNEGAQETTPSVAHAEAGSSIAADAHTTTSSLAEIPLMSIKHEPGQTKDLDGTAGGSTAMIVDPPSLKPAPEREEIDQLNELHITTDSDERLQHEVRRVLRSTKDEGAETQAGRLDAPAPNTTDDGADFMETIRGPRPDAKGVWPTIERRPLRFPDPVLSCFIDISRHRHNLPVCPPAQRMTSRALMTRLANQHRQSDSKVTFQMALGYAANGRMGDESLPACNMYPDSLTPSSSPALFSIESSERRYYPHPAGREGWIRVPVDLTIQDKTVVVPCAPDGKLLRF